MEKMSWKRCLHVSNKMGHSLSLLKYATVNKDAEIRLNQLADINNVQGVPKNWSTLKRCIFCSFGT